jgi:hypothetical protein
VSFLLVLQGGGLLVGSPASPFPGRAIITLTGPPTSRELPLYGAKVVAVREGTVQLFGQPKLPPYTQLAATVSPGDKSITLVGPANWAVGDEIAIASSSYYGGLLVVKSPADEQSLVLGCMVRCTCAAQPAAFTSCSCDMQRSKPTRPVSLVSAAPRTATPFCS